MADAVNWRRFAHWKTPHLFPKDGDALLSAWIVGSFRAVLQFDCRPVFRRGDAHHPETGGFIYSFRGSPRSLTGTGKADAYTSSSTGANSCTRLISR